MQTVVTSALQAVQLGERSQSNVGRPSKPFLGKPQEPQLAAGKAGTIDPEKTCRYCKDTGNELDNCKHLQYKEDLLAGKKSGEGQTRGSYIWGSQGGDRSGFLPMIGIVIHQR